MARAVSEAGHEFPEVVQATDKSGAVNVTLEDHGRRVTRVVVAANWKDKLGADSLGVAIVEAILSVQLAPVERISRAVADAWTAPAVPLSRPNNTSATRQTLPWTGRCWARCSGSSTALSMSS